MPRHATDQFRSARACIEESVPFEDASALAEPGVLAEAEPFIDELPAESGATVL